MNEQFVAIFCGLAAAAIGFSFIAIWISCKAFENSYDSTNAKLTGGRDKKTDVPRHIKSFKNNHNSDDSQA